MARGGWCRRAGWWRRKGCAATLQAFARFRELYPAARLTIAGEGPLRAELEKSAAELGVASAVTMRGFLSQADLNALYAESHLFLHPSEMTSDQNQEGVPNSMLEAMATGLPVIATWHGGIPEAVTHERDGLLVPERDVEALFQAMRRLAAAPEEWARFGAAAAETVRAEFEQTRAIAALEDCYDEALALGAARARANGMSAGASRGLRICSSGFRRSCRRSATARRRRWRGRAWRRW